MLEVAQLHHSMASGDLLYGVHGDPVELYRTRDDSQHEHNRIETDGGGKMALCRYL
ncbi:MAG: hypothetical protein R2932_60230 [Caldilineaceae bacterium]